MTRSSGGPRRHREAGFTATEAMVSIVIMALLTIGIVTMFQASNKISRRANLQGDTQQAARVAMDTVTKDLRSLGFELDMGGGQRALVFGAPWDIIFNANSRPTADDLLNPGFPRAMDLAFAPATVPAGGALYAPTGTFGTGAETIRFTLDSTGDGALDANDLGDDAEEGTPNPRDFVLRKEVYGAEADGTNGGAGQTVGIVRGPIADPDGTLPTPLFQYWMDDDDDTLTPEVLWGDGDADGALSQAEIAALGPVPAASLALVTRVIVTVTSEDASPDATGDFRTRSLVSSVAFRNLIRRTGVITGTVFQDGDGDGSYDPSTESPLADVTVRLSTGRVAETSVTGQYVFEVAPGSYTVTELDPAGYTSTTPNTVAVDVDAGSTNFVSFGDRPGAGVGTITGKVYNDLNQNQQLDNDESGLEGIVVTLHTGQSDSTDAEGNYSFSVPVGSYTVVETDLVGWGSTTPNVVEVVLTTDGETQRADFGDVEGSGFGTLQGLVYLDLDNDGEHDPDEDGIADVPVSVSNGDSTLTNGNGIFSFSLNAGLYTVKEFDLSGYSSSTPNTLVDVLVLPDSTVSVAFGDIYAGSVDFTVVTVGTTDRALSIASADLFEDNKADPDIVLGTQITAGSANLHGWHNDRRNSGTAITALFDASPSFSRTAGQPIPAMTLSDLNDDGVQDCVTGLDYSAGNNLQTWITLTSGGDKGKFDTAPAYQYATLTGSSVQAIAALNWPGWGRKLFFVGTATSSGDGRVEVWVDTGGGGLGHTPTADLTADTIGTLGPVTSIVIGDFDKDGYPDVAVGQDEGSHVGRVSVFTAVGGGSWAWIPDTVLPCVGAVLSMAAVDMNEDGDEDIDLLIGSSTGSGTGAIELWTNQGGNFGTADTSVVGGRIASDWVDPGGEVMSMAVETIDADVFPDVVAGLRTNPYQGALKVYRTTGYLPSSGTEWSHDNSGEVVTITMNDFNIDGLHDIAVGTRTASTSGELVVYFGQ